MAKSVLTNSPWSAHYLYTKSNGSNHNKQAAMLIIFQLILLKKKKSGAYWHRTILRYKTGGRKSTHLEAPLYKCRQSIEAKRCARSQNTTTTAAAAAAAATAPTANHNPNYCLLLLLCTITCAVVWRFFIFVSLLISQQVRVHLLDNMR